MDIFQKSLEIFFMFHFLCKDAKYHIVRNRIGILCFLEQPVIRGNGTLFTLDILFQKTKDEIGRSHV